MPVLYGQQTYDTSTKQLIGSHKLRQGCFIVSSTFLWGQSESMFGVAKRLSYMAIPIPSSSISGIELFCLKSTAALFVISDANRSPRVSTLFV